MGISHPQRWISLVYVELYILEYWIPPFADPMCINHLHIHIYCHLIRTSRVINVIYDPNPI